MLSSSETLFKLQAVHEALHKSMNLCAIWCTRGLVHPLPWSISNAVSFSISRFGPVYQLLFSYETVDETLTETSTTLTAIPAALCHFLGLNRLPMQFIRNPDTFLWQTRAAGLSPSVLLLSSSLWTWFLLVPHRENFHGIAWLFRRDSFDLLKRARDSGLWVSNYMFSALNGNFYKMWRKRKILRKTETEHNLTRTSTAHCWEPDTKIGQIHGMDKASSFSPLIHGQL